MYHPDNSPVGLYVEEGRELVRANTSAGPGNFHMRPNGVFYLTGEVAGILETRSFIKQKPQVDFATQSGPMLVIDGEVNARFVRYGGSKKYRVAKACARFPSCPSQERNFNITHSTTILTDGCVNFRKFLIEGTKPHLKKINEYVERSLMLVTALSPVIGYDKGRHSELSA